MPTTTTTPASRRRRVQTLDHLDDAEMNDVVNRMFGTVDDDQLSELMPWRDVWQCDGSRTESRMPRPPSFTPLMGGGVQRSALKSRTNNHYQAESLLNTPMDKRSATSSKLGSLYDPVFNPSSYHLDVAQSSVTTHR